MGAIREQIAEVLKANLTFRRIIALGIGLACIVVCVAVLTGILDLKIWQTAVALVLGLMFFEWAG